MNDALVEAQIIRGLLPARRRLVVVAVHGPLRLSYLVLVLIRVLQAHKFVYHLLLARRRQLAVRRDRLCLGQIVRGQLRKGELVPQVAELPLHVVRFYPVQVEHDPALGIASQLHVSIRLATRLCWNGAHNFVLNELPHRVIFLVRDDVVQDGTTLVDRDLLSSSVHISAQTRSIDLMRHFFRFEAIG